MTDLTLGASGRTVAHFDINEFTDTQRLFSLVWFLGDHPDWTNSQNQTPADSGVIDQEHAQVSTVRASFRGVHFDGRNRARAGGEPGGAFDPNPDVRNAFGIEGGLVVVSELPDLIFFFKPINAPLVVVDSRFTDLPGGRRFAPQLVGPGDPAWTFGPDAVNASVTVRRSIFEDMYAGVLAGDLSDVDVTVDSSAFRREVYGVVLWTNYQSTDGDAMGTRHRPPLGQDQ